MTRAAKRSCCRSSDRILHGYVNGRKHLNNYAGLAPPVRALVACHLYRYPVRVLHPAQHEAAKLAPHERDHRPLRGVGWGATVDKSDVTAFWYIVIGASLAAVLFFVATYERTEEFQERDTSDHGYERSSATIEAYWEERARE